MRVAFKDVKTDVDKELLPGTADFVNAALRLLEIRLLRYNGTTLELCKQVGVLVMDNDVIDADIIPMDVVLPMAERTLSENTVARLKMPKADNVFMCVFITSHYNGTLSMEMPGPEASN